MSIKETFKELRDILDKLQKMNLSMNGELPIFNLASKIVIKEDGLILRIEDARAIKTRIAFAELTKEVTGTSFFLTEKLLEENNLYGISSQIALKPFTESDERYPLILPPINFNYDAMTEGDWEKTLAVKAYHDYGESAYQKLTDFCRKWQVMFIHQDNVGISATNKVQCFDYAANIALDQEGKITDGLEVGQKV